VAEGLLGQLWLALARFTEEDAVVALIRGLVCTYDRGEVAFYLFFF